MNAGPAAASPASEESVVRYEDLRHHIIEGFGSRPRLGLAVLLREGLAAWITTCAPAAHSAVPASDPSDGVAHRLGDEAHADLVHVLTAMALHRFDRRKGNT